MAADATGRYQWLGWEAETDLDNDDDREGVYFLTICDPGGEEIATIVHRTQGGEYPLDHPWALDKEREAKHIVDALNDFDARSGSTPVWVDPEEIAEMAGCIGVVLAWGEDNPGQPLNEDMLANLERAREVANLIGNDFDVYQQSGHSPLRED